MIFFQVVCLRQSAVVLIVCGAIQRINVNYEKIA